jgi:ATP adenylyltransferase
MSEFSHHPEARQNIWAPWRMEYIQGLEEKSDGCFLCEVWADESDEAGNLVVWRGERAFCVLNRFPYTGGHCLVAPAGHVATLGELDEPTLAEMTRMLTDLESALQEALGPDGFNIGANIGRCAGAGLPGHIHMHIVPRWLGDTNFMPVFGDVRVIPEFLQQTREKLLAAGRKLDLPSARGHGG